MNILVACEESQRVCLELRKLGHRAFSNDIIPCSGDHPQYHIIEDTLKLINGNISFKTEDGKIHHQKTSWDMIIAFPPCTYMTNAGACRMYPTKGNIDKDRLTLALEAKDFFMAILNANCEKICVENPRPLKVVGLPLETQRIQPYEYGEPFKKMTYLWLKGLPNLKPTNIITDNVVSYVNGGSKDHNGAYRKNEGITHKQKDRSKTFIGIAKAMATQWT